MKSPAKLQSKKGFTLSELLVALLLCLLTTAVMYVIVSAAGRNYVRMQKESEAQILCSSLKTAIEDELLYATNIDGDDYDYHYFSHSRGGGASCILKSESGRIFLVRTENSTMIPLVPDNSYVLGAYAELDCTWSKTHGKFTVNITIYTDNTETTALASSNFAVEPLLP